MRLWILFCFILFLNALCPAKLRADLNGDCRVDMADLAILMSEWLESEDCSVALGEELLSDPELVTGLPWTAEGGWAFADGTAVSLIGAANEKFYQAVNLEDTKVYRITIVIHANNLAMLRPYINGTMAVDMQQAGSYTYDFIAESTGSHNIGVIKTDIDVQSVVESVSFKEVIPDTGGIAMDVFEELWEN